ncbi:EGF-like domain-containing protein 2 [Haliotis asinina]|uniref:EGF-like domain-containing protein 2 n=1 Tax=Haliotis asinina TaxID=109174 RepID=UPI0035320D10
MRQGHNIGTYAAEMRQVHNIGTYTAEMRQGHNIDTYTAEMRQEHNIGTYTDEMRQEHNIGTDAAEMRQVHNIGTYTAEMRQGHNIRTYTAEMRQEHNIGTYTDEMRQEHNKGTYTAEMRQVHNIGTYVAEMRQVHNIGTYTAEMQQGHNIGTYTAEMRQGHNIGTYVADMRQVHNIGTYAAEMRQAHNIGTYAAEMRQVHNIGTYTAEMRQVHNIGTYTAEIEARSTMSPPRNLLYLVLLVGFVFLINASFDCRRRGQGCRNEADCSKDRGNCTCKAGFEGYDCSINASQINRGSCNETICENGGTCVSTDVNATCVCAPGYYGANCSFRRFQVECKSGSLLVGVNPLGNFDGFIYEERNRDTCTFEAVSPPTNGKEGWEGYARDLNNTDPECGNISPSFDQQPPENSTDISNASTTSYTRIVYIVYEKTFMTSLDEVLNFTCIFNTQSVEIYKSAYSVSLEASDMNQLTREAQLSPVKFQIESEGKGTNPKEVQLGEVLTLTFTIDSLSFDGARLESCVFNDTNPDGANLTVVADSCVQDDAKSILSKPIDTEDDNKTITITIAIRVFKFVSSDQLGISCKVKACPPGFGDGCEPRDCSNTLTNQKGYGRKRRDAQKLQTQEFNDIIHIRGPFLDEDQMEEKPDDVVKSENQQVCSISKEVTTIMAALGTVTIILLIVTIAMVSRAVITRQASPKCKGRDEGGDNFSTLGQPRAFSRKY